MVSFSCRQATAEDIRQAGAWQPAAPFFHNAFGDTFSCQTLLDERSVSCGLLRYINGAKPFLSNVRTDQKSSLLCFQLLFSPDFCASFRQLAIEFCLQWLRRCFHPTRFTVCVYADDVGLLNIYKRLDFLFHAQTADFICLELDDRPFLDASMPLQDGIPQYEGDPPFRRTRYAEKENGGYNVSALTMSVHTGTHIDTPAHVGLEGAESIDISLLHGTIQLIDWSKPNFDTILSNRIFLAHAQRGLTQKEAELFIHAGILLLGIDRLSVGFAEDEWIVHHRLLQNGVIVLENADLGRFSAGWYQMRCLPLSIPGSDGIPVRLLLREVWP